MKNILTLIVCALVLAANAQEHRVPSKRPNTEMKIGDRFYAESYFYSAVSYYKDAVRQDSTNRYATYWLAMSLLQARDYANAEIFFNKFYSIQPGEKTNKKKWAKEDEVLFNKAGYYYGQVLHRNGKYDEAIKYLNKFKQTYKPKDPTDNLLDMAKIEIEGCEFARQNPHKAKVKIESAGPGVNHSYTEGSPFGIGENDLYYSSLKISGMSSGDTLIFVKGNKSNRVYQIFHSVAEGHSWSKGKPLENKDINEDGYIVGNGTFNKDLTHFYFTKCLEVDDDRSLCNIFSADYKNGTFSNVQRLPEPINSKEKYTSTQPTVRTANDGMEIIYFSSDQPGGAGGMDIWYCTRSKDGDYKGPQLLKGPINTKGDEITPYFDDSTKTLYFSSDGHPGYGGLDIFQSTEQSDLSWGEVKNVGAPLNSGADDLYYSKSSDQSNGFLVSNREGSVPLDGIKTASDDIFTWRNFRYAVEGIAFKEGYEGGGALDGAMFKLYRKTDDGQKVLVAVDSTHKDGSYFFKLQPETDYLVEVDRPGFENKMEQVTTKGLAGEDTLQNNMKVAKASVILKGLVAEKDKAGTFVKDANVTLVEVYPNGLEQTVYYMQSNPNFYFQLDKGKKYKIVIKKNEYFTSTTEINPDDYGKVDTITKEIPITHLEINKEYTLQNVLYEFGKSTLTETSKSVLDNLYTIMQENPTFIVELSANTDAIGSESANMKLSQARADACVNYLIGKGIAKDRLVAKGYGETRPKVPNTTPDGKDDPVGRAINRRTEFKIIGLKKDQ